MCNILNESITDGNSKKAQIDEWKRYFDFEKAGQRFLITEVYDEPLPKNDRRANGNNSIYVKYIELQLMYFLSNKAGYECTLKKNGWHKILGLINDNYTNFKYDSVVQSGLDEIVSSFDVKDFYRRVPLKLNKILFDALRNMKNRCLLEYYEETVIAETINKEKSYRLANSREIKLIVEAKNQVLADMGLLSMTHVFLKFKNDEFYKRLNDQLYLQYEWDYTFSQYIIIYSEKCIKQDIPKTGIILEKMQLNQKVIEAVNEQAKNRYDANCCDCEEVYNRNTENRGIFGLPDEAVSIKEPFRLSDTYIDAQEKLSDYMLKIGGTS